MSKLVSRTENYSEWYNQLVNQAWLAENSPVRWCMIIKPHGFAIWENIKNILDLMFKKTGHQNAYFPLLIPKSFLSKEAKHVDGFAKECAVVTHHRLKIADDGKTIEVDPDAKLDEELIIRPTSETIIWSSYKNWIHSYRDLPLLINQRANVVRREMRTRAFLRTTEFLRQEGHTAHASKEEAKAEALKMHDVYNDFMRNFLAISSVLGEKSESEKFAGAENTYTLEPMMQDNKALQIGTSHFLWQTFSQAFDVKFTNKNNELEYVRASSRWVSTRMMWGLIMSHSDDQGLVLPPAIAPVHIIFVPIYKTPEDLDAIMDYMQNSIDNISAQYMTVKSKYLWEHEIPVVLKIDDDENKSLGWKFNEIEMQGIPLRIVVWKKELEAGTCELYQRDTQEKVTLKIGELADKIVPILESMQDNLLKKNIKRREERSYSVNSRDEFKEKVKEWFVLAHRDGTEETEAKIKEETNATIRCIPFDAPEEAGECVYSGQKSNKRVLFAISY